MCGKNGARPLELTVLEPTLGQLAKSISRGNAGHSVGEAPQQRTDHFGFMRLPLSLSHHYCQQLLIIIRKLSRVFRIPEDEVIVTKWKEVECLELLRLTRDYTSESRSQRVSEALPGYRAVTRDWGGPSSTTAPRPTGSLWRPRGLFFGVTAAAAPHEATSLEEGLFLASC